MKKLNYNDVYEDCKKNGYLLLDKEYKGIDKKMSFIDKEGYKYYTTYEKIRNKCDINKYHKNNIYTIENIEHYLKINNLPYKYVSGEYMNFRSKLIWEDIIGYKYYCSFQDVIRGVRKISKYNPYSINNIILYIKLNHRTDTLLSTNYVSNGAKTDDKLSFCCCNGHVFKMRWHDYQSGKGCPKCAKKYTNLEEFKNAVYKIYGNDYSVLGEYINSQEKILIKHNICGTEFKIRPNSFIQGHGCPNNLCCKKHGENHYRWNSNLTDKDREKNKSRLTISGYKEWRRKVFNRDNYKCIICGCSYSRENPLIPHHLNSWDNNKNQRLDVNNGATLCRYHHIQFHNIYGYGNNTQIQFEDYIHNHDNTEVNNQIAKG